MKCFHSFNVERLLADIRHARVAASNSCALNHLLLLPELCLWHMLLYHTDLIVSHIFLNHSLSQLPNLHLQLPPSQALQPHPSQISPLLPRQPGRCDIGGEPRPHLCWSLKEISVCLQRAQADIYSHVSCQTSSRQKCFQWLLLLKLFPIIWKQISKFAAKKKTAANKEIYSGTEEECCQCQVRSSWFKRLHLATGSKTTLFKKKHPGGMGDNDPPHRGLEGPDRSRPPNNQSRNRP